MQKVLRYWGRKRPASSVRSRITTQINQGMLMAGEVLKALIFRPKVGESGRDGKEECPLLIRSGQGPAAVHTKLGRSIPHNAFILISARQAFNAEVNGHQQSVFANGTNCSWC